MVGREVNHATEPAPATGAAEGVAHVPPPMSAEAVPAAEAAGDWREIVRLEGVQKYFGAIHALRDIDLAVGRNEIVGLIGDTGAGITVDSTVANLSGGERQGIAIGRAMHWNADLIVLDEPTVALAVAEVRKVLDFVRRIRDSGRACIYIEHNLAHVHAVADRLVILDRGRVVAEVIPKDMSVIELTEYLIDLQHGA